MRASEPATRHRALAVLALLACAAGAHADPAGDRMRDQLRQAVTQLRQLQDENAAQKQKLAAATAELEALRGPGAAELDRMRAELVAARVEADGAEARYAQYDQALGQWKQAHGEAVTEARKQQAEAQRLETERGALAARAQACESANVALVGIGNELLGRYRDKGVIEAMRVKEPLLGLHRVEFERLAQEYHGRIVDATLAEPAADGAAPAASDGETTP